MNHTSDASQIYHETAGAPGLLSSSAVRTPPRAAAAVDPHLGNRSGTTADAARSPAAAEPRTHSPSR